ncbi:MAG TPA: PH domain-containing protein [Mycobacteriales bacterium]|nr:PH domain-containing protein [Mycobacteriales bacterium]
MSGPERPPGRAGMSRPGPAAPTGVRIRTPRTSLVAVLVLAICVLPLASAAPWLAVLWLLPLVALVWVLRVGVDADPEGLTVRALLGSRRLPWAEVAGLRIGDRGRLAAVLQSGGAVRLPVLRARHLPLVAAVSGGHLPDPEAPAQ